MEKWYVCAKKADFEQWAARFGISPVLARLIRNRDMTREEEVRSYLNGTLEDCPSPWLLHGMERAVEIMIEKLEQKASVRIIGDYDVDGVCSSYILTKGLQVLGAAADTVIPHRVRDGYGLNERLIEEAVRDGIQLLITCDNGIAAAEPIRRAVGYGMTVIVTDHHEVPYLEENGIRKEILPPAHAVIDPRQERCGYPFPNICGGVVAYKLIQALMERAVPGKEREGGVWQRLRGEFLQLAALATVCDVMELREENRIFVKEGLKAMKNTENPGLRALLEVNGLTAGNLSAYHLGFVVGPCLNAPGRLDTARYALELLESRTKAQAMGRARELKECNDSRRNLTQQGVEQAEEYLARHRLEADKVLAIYLPETHESLAGIIAGKVREKRNRPVFVLTKGREGVKGSGRSVDAYPMFEAMTQIKEFFRKYGGHRLAAGLTLKSWTQLSGLPGLSGLSERYRQPGEEASLTEEEKAVEAFRRELNARCTLTEEDLAVKVRIDAPMPLSYATKELARDLDKMEPFGAGNPKPLFAQKGLRFVGGRKMGAKQAAARFTVLTPEGGERELVYFGDLECFAGFLDGKYGSGSAARLYDGNGDFEVSVTYQFGIHTYQGKESLQFVMRNYC
ncbi:MAG: single-stranded-DNA-specific exonuclease RecJ [Clostridium sp.]|jgi:single-stranded-DNA-specific exonuclease|nr:single-stranded-DNA-specific exonuclease RecJ [Clostridium sp.]